MSKSIELTGISKKGLKEHIYFPLATTDHMTGVRLCQLTSTNFPKILLFRQA